MQSQLAKLVLLAGLAKCTLASSRTRRLLGTTRAIEGHEALFDPRRACTVHGDRSKIFRSQGRACQRREEVLVCQLKSSEAIGVQVQL